MLVGFNSVTFSSRGPIPRMSARIGLATQGIPLNTAVTPTRKAQGGLYNCDRITLGEDEVFPPEFIQLEDLERTIYFQDLHSKALREDNQMRLLSLPGKAKEFGVSSEELIKPLTTETASRLTEIMQKLRNLRAKNFKF